MTLSQLDEMISLLEETIPASPASAKGAALAKSLEAEMKAYFAALARAMPDLTELYFRYVKQEG